MNVDFIASKYMDAFQADKMLFIQEIAPAQLEGDEDCMEIDTDANDSEVKNNHNATSNGHDSDADKVEVDPQGRLDLNLDDN